MEIQLKIINIVMLHFLTYKTQTNDIPLSQSPQAFIREIVVKNHIDVLS